MDSPRVHLRTLVLALLCLAVVSFAAATLGDTTTQDDKIGLGGSGQENGAGVQRTPQTPTTPENPGDNASRSSPLNFNISEGAPISICVPWLHDPLVQLGLIGVFLGVVLTTRRLRSTADALAVGFVLSYPGVFIYLLLTSCREFGMPNLGNPGQPAQPGGGFFGGSTTVSPPSLPSQLLLFAVVATLLVVTALVLTSDHDLRDEEETELADDDEEVVDEGTDVAAIGRSAGRAAERLEVGGEFENEIYRAWAEMTDHLAVEHPESSTPAEFATAAVEAGMDAEDVDHLTTLFEEVRYGDAAATEEREAAAIETLRRIESAYAGDGP